MHPGFVPRNHPNAVKRRGVDDTIDDRETPPCVFDPLHAEFGFTLDAAAGHHNAKTPRYYTLEGGYFESPREGRLSWNAFNGLTGPWGENVVWCNPPFSGVRPWVEKAWAERAATVVLLLPNNRAEQPFWQQLIEPHRDRPGSCLTTRNLPKRRPFLHRGAGIGNRTSKNPPFGLIAVIWDRRPLA